MSIKFTLQGRLLIVEGHKVPYGRQTFVVPAPYSGKIKPSVRWLFRVWRKDVVQYVSVGELHKVLSNN